MAWAPGAAHRDRKRLFPNSTTSEPAKLPFRSGRLTQDPCQLFLREFARLARSEIGRASCRERVCQYVYIWVVAVSSKKTIIPAQQLNDNQKIQKVFIKPDI